MMDVRIVLIVWMCGQLATFAGIYMFDTCQSSILLDVYPYRSYTHGWQM